MKGREFKGSRNLEALDSMRGITAKRGLDSRFSCLGCKTAINDLTPADVAITEVFVGRLSFRLCDSCINELLKVIEKTKLAF